MAESLIRIMPERRNLDRRTPMELSGNGPGRWHFTLGPFHTWNLGQRTMLAPRDLISSQIHG